MSEYVEVTPELMAGFLDEAPEYLAMLDEGLMAFEEQCGAGISIQERPEDQERMTEMFRAAHSLKGLAAAMGFNKVRDLTHLMETLFDQVRMGQRDLDARIIESLFGVFDKLRELVAELADPPDTPVAIDEAMAALDALLNSGDASVDAAPVVEANAPVSEDAPSADSPAAAEQNGVLADPELAQLFIETTAETLEELNQGLLRLEQAPSDSELLNSVFRHAHNIKGASGAAGLDRAYHLTHDMETVLDCLRSKDLEVNGALMNALFSAVDSLRADIEDVKNGCVDEASLSDTSKLFTDWLAPDKAAKVSDAVDRPSAPEQSWDSDRCYDHADGLTVCVSFPADFVESEIQSYLIHNKLAELGTILSSDPDINAMDGSATIEKITFVVDTSAPASEVEEIVGAYSVGSVKVSGGEPPAEPPADAVVCADIVETGAPSARAPQRDPAPSETKENAMPTASRERAGVPASGGESAAGGPAGTGSASRPAGVNRPAAAKASETIRVDLERLDQLMNLGGELVIHKARFAQIHSRLDPVFSGPNLRYLVDDLSEKVSRLGDEAARLAHGPKGARDVSGIADIALHLSHDFQNLRDVMLGVHDARGAMNDFGEALHSLDRVSEGIQKRIMETRMVSIGPLFQRFRRAVRDMAKSTGKEVELVLHGEATELDKRMIDELADPLTHMVRNSVDHGLESPDGRSAAGKGRVGRVELDAYHRGRHICIEVRDDGGGVDVEAVKQKLYDRELATPAQIEQMSDKEIVQYVFKPGFSTAAQVTDLSGRGMGMDIVVNKIENLSGTVEIDSVSGKGTRVVIKLPLTLAIINALVARIGGGAYAIPLEMVAEIITVPRSGIRAIQGNRVIQLRERVVPVAMFEEVFTGSAHDMRTATRDDPHLTLVILTLQEEHVGLVVDGLIGQEDVVIKSISDNYRNVSGVAGASIMGDGSVSLILDVAATMAMFAERQQARNTSRAASETVAVPAGVGS